MFNNDDIADRIDHHLAKAEDSLQAAEDDDDQATSDHILRFAGAHQQQVDLLLRVEERNNREAGRAR